MKKLVIFATFLRLGGCGSDSGHSFRTLPPLRMVIKLLAMLTLYDRVSGGPGYSTVVEFMRTGINKQRKWPAKL